MLYIHVYIYIDIYIHTSDWRCPLQMRRYRILEYTLQHSAQHTATHCNTLYTSCPFLKNANDIASAGRACKVGVWALYVCVFSSSSITRAQGGQKPFNNSSTVILQGKLTREWTETESERASEQEQVRERARARARGTERERESAREREGKSEREREEDRWAERARQRNKVSARASERERERSTVRIGTGWGCHGALDSYSAVDFTSVVPVLQCVAVFCSVLQCVAACCSVLQCVAACCSACVYVCGWRAPRTFDSKSEADLTSVAPVLQCDAM